MEPYTRNFNSQIKNLRRNRLMYSEKHKTGFRTPASPASIPTKYQTIFVPEVEKRGFNSKALRFAYSLNQNENPGPGSYDIGQTASDVNNVSFSKKGTGGFPSKAARSCFLKTDRTPAPNTYNLRDDLFSKKDFSKSNSSMFHQPITTQVEYIKNKTPAPNQYDVSIIYSHPHNKVSAHAAFVSKTKRELIQSNHLKGPSPCHYTVNDSLVKESPVVLVSSFKSKTSRNVLNATSSNPGPANYDPFKVPETQKRQTFQRKHYLCFSAPAVPVSKSPPIPGPGQYDIVDFKGPPKHHISSAVFVSNTSRWAGDVSGEGVPGPGSYRPGIPGKQSFLYNSNKKWIPV